MATFRDDDQDDGAGGGLSGGRAPDDEPRDGQVADAASEEETEHASDPSVPTATRIAQAAVLLVAVIFGVFALANSHAVDFSWVFGETQVERDATGGVEEGGVPLIVLLLVSFILGATMGGWWTWQAQRSRARDRAARADGRG